MPLRMAPGEKLGAAACAAGTKSKAQPMLQTPVARPTGRLPSLQTHSPARPLAEEQTEAHALLAKAANHPDWRVASHALDELMRQLLVLHRLLEALERLAPPGASKR
jgi:hypothetical protein